MLGDPRCRGVFSVVAESASYAEPSGTANSYLGCASTREKVSLHRHHHVVIVFVVALPSSSSHRLTVIIMSLSSSSLHCRHRPLTVFVVASVPSHPQPLFSGRIAARSFSCCLRCRGGILRCCGDPRGTELLRCRGDVLRCCGDPLRPVLPPLSLLDPPLSRSSVVIRN